MIHNTEPKPLWSAYAAGIMLGVVLFFSFFIMGRGLGSSQSLNRLTAIGWETVSQETAHGFSYYANYFAEPGGALTHDYSIYQMIGVLVGGFVSGMLGRRTRVGVDKGPRSGYGSRLLLAFLGGAVMAFGARIARGCTSGQILTGGAVGAVGSWVMMACFFGGAYAVAYLVRKQWT